MTRIIVSVIKSAVFILGIVLASCFIGRGGGQMGRMGAEWPLVPGGQAGAGRVAEP